jgi:hypothetical protein
MLDIIAFVAEHGCEFAAKRVHCEDREHCPKDHRCEHREDGEVTGERCSEEAIWTILLPTPDGLAIVDLCGAHAAILLLAAEEMMEEVE